MKIIIVVATIREECIKTFFQKWEEELCGYTVIVVEDHKQKEILITRPFTQHFCWEDIDKELGADSWIIPRRTGAIKSFGIWKASQMRPDIIVSLDDDCLPGDIPFLEKHCQRLTKVVEAPAWTSTIKGVKPRGEPFLNTKRRVIPVLNHGLWNTNLDLDAPTQLATNNVSKLRYKEQIIPRGMYFAMCGMNLAFNVDIAPLMYFGLQGPKYGIDRFDDIWCGIIMKRICDHLDFWVSSGSPIVRHNKASNVWENLHKEVAGIEINETFWQAVDSIELTSCDLLDCFDEVSDKLPLQGTYWDSLKHAMKIWSNLFRV